ncbi:MAG: hypothetical protein JSW71_02305, partial [Gemmatimonadota bacterium]
TVGYRVHSVTVSHHLQQLSMTMLYQPNSFTLPQNAGSKERGAESGRRGRRSLTDLTVAPAGSAERARLKQEN